MSADYAEESAKELHLEEHFRKLPPEEGSQIYFSALSHFTNAKGNPTWWWEHFRDELSHSSKCWRDGKAFERILKIVPDPDERVWFIPEEDRTPYPVYLSSPRVIQKVIGNAYSFEYYILNREYKWLLCENHHEVMVAIGEPLATNLKRLDT